MDKIVSFENCKFEDGEIVIDDVGVTYSQDNDCTEDRDGCQVLHIQTRNNGVARFISFSTDGEHWWSIDSVDSLVKLFDDFKKRADYDETKITVE